MKAYVIDTKTTIPPFNDPPLDHSLSGSHLELYGRLVESTFLCVRSVGGMLDICRLSDLRFDGFLGWFGLA
mgnify:CR=1 FL=1